MSDIIDDDLFKRMVLMNQYLILQAVDRENADDWHNAINNLERHRPIDELPYVDILRSYARSPFTTRDRGDLLDTIDVFSLLQDAEDAGMKPPEAGLGDTRFPGYSGNEEGGHLSYYSDMVKKGERWPSLRRTSDRDLNSHFPMLDGYARMVGRWKTLGSPRPLSKSDFDAILYEWVHPENR